MAVFLVRHASAGTRKDFDSHDLRRRLDRRGLAQAAALVDLLDGRSISRLLSSPADRCVETLAPLATKFGLGVELADALIEGNDIDEAWQVVVGATERKDDTVLCSHGDVIPDIIRRAQMRGMEVPGKAGCSKGSMWKLTRWNGETFEKGVYTPVKG